MNVDIKKVSQETLEHLNEAQEQLDVIFMNLDENVFDENEIIDLKVQLYRINKALEHFSKKVVN